MTIAGILLTALSAGCHATWNLLSKSGADPVAFMRKALMWSAACYLPLFIVMSFRIAFSPTYLLCAGGSGVMVGLYFFTLSTAYRLGDLSVAYPLARSFPVLILAFSAVVWGRPPTAVATVGVGAIVAGCFLLPLRRFSLGPAGFHLPAYLHVASFWALAAAAWTAGFSLVDKHAATIMPAGGPVVRLASQVGYVYLQNGVAWIVIELIARLTRRPSPPVERRGPLAAGLLFLVSYSLIIMALATDPVTYVVSFRQVSIVIASIVSMLVIERRFSAPRLLGVIVIFVGIVLIATA